MLNLKNLNNNSCVINKQEVMSPRNQGTMFSFNTAKMLEVTDLDYSSPRIMITNDDYNNQGMPQLSNRRLG